MPRRPGFRSPEQDLPATSSSLLLFACERCSHRKQKCDRLIPQCTPCRDSESACTKSKREDAIVQGKNDETTRKGYVTTLLERIAACEARAEELGISGGGQGSHTFPEAAGRTAAGRATETGNATPGRLHGQHPETSTTSRGLNLSFLSLSAMAEPRNRAGEFLRQLSMSRIVAGVTETYGGNPEAVSRVDSLWDGISKYIRQPIGTTHRLYIPPDEAAKALQTYLDVVDFRFPRLPVTKVQAGIDAISATDDVLYRETLGRDPAHIFMAYAVAAIVPLVSDNYPISQGSWVSVHLLGKCLKVLDRVFNQEDGVDAIHCLHLLVILSMHCSAAGSAWHLIGFAMNKCIALGYHREDARIAANVSPEEIQQRRWAFWGCYLLDRLISAALDRPFSINDRDVTVPLPEVPHNNGASSRESHNQELADDRGEDDPAVQASRGRFAGEDVSQQGIRESSGPTTKPRQALDTHLFRYAILLHSVVATRSTHDSDNVNFDDNLGQALLWRSQTPAHDGDTTMENYLYQTSLYNTLMLRIVITEILRAFEYGQTDGNGSEDAAFLYRFSESDLGEPFSYSYSKSNISRSTAWEHFRLSEPSRIRALKVAGVCRAVARSLDRQRMVGRHYLSMLTGYSALSMALGCLYCMVLQTLGGTTDPTQMVIHADTDLPQADDALASGVGTSWTSAPSTTNPSCACGSGQTDTAPTGDHLPSTSGMNLIPCKYRSLNSILDVAFQKLDIVGRQFPRLLEYRSGAERLRFLVNQWQISQALGNEALWQSHLSLQGEVDSVRKWASDIGPGHLRKLAEVIMYVIGPS